MSILKRAKNDPIFELLTAQSQHLVSAADMLMRAINAQPDERVTINKEMHEIEHLADDACHTVLRKVNQSFMLPFDREDVYSLSGKMDDCVDFIDEVSEHLVLYKPLSLPDGIASVIEIIQECARLTHEEMERFAHIDEATHVFCVKVNDLEDTADGLYRSMIDHLFDNETDAIELVKKKLILDSLESAVDSFESLANVIESIAIKES